MELMRQIAARASSELAAKWFPYAVNTDKFSREFYVKFLSLHFHMINGSARHLMLIASHKDLTHRARLRGFLIDFALQHEKDHLLAESDLRQLGNKILPATLDIKLWWSYFNNIVEQRPFIRLGAAFTFEQAICQMTPMLEKIQDQCNFITPRSSQYLSLLVSPQYIERSQKLWEALQTSHLNVSQISDMQLGASECGTLYERMSQWIFEIPVSAHSPKAA